MNKKVISFFAISNLLLLLVAVMFAGSYFPSGSVITKASPKSLAYTAPAISQIELEDNYKKYASDILAIFYAKPAKYSSPEIARGAREDLLGLEVPAALKDLHLDLVISLGLVEQEASSGQVSESGAQKVEDLIKNNPWLLNNNI